MDRHSFPQAAPADAAGPRVALAVDTVGHLVPRAAFAGRVHSVFARACNIAGDGTLLTLASADAGNGPATLRLAHGAPEDLRRLFDVGERVAWRDGRVQTRRSDWDLAHARVWRPGAARPLLRRDRIDAHLRFAGERLAQHRCTRTGVIDGAGAPVVAALQDACRTLDGERAARQVERLIGWGEGLTPAGDDFLVGLTAGLDALVQGDERRCRFRAGLASTLALCGTRTTPIAAHYLRLAAHGHYNETLVCLRDALLAERRRAPVAAALRRALAIGATSGADTASGLLTALAAWLPAPSMAAAA